MNIEQDFLEEDEFEIEKQDSLAQKLETQSFNEAEGLHMETDQGLYTFSPNTVPPVVANTQLKPCYLALAKSGHLNIEGSRNVKFSCWSVLIGTSVLTFNNNPSDVKSANLLGVSTIRFYLGLENVFDDFKCYMTDADNVHVLGRTRSSTMMNKIKFIF